MRRALHARGARTRVMYQSSFSRPSVIVRSPVSRQRGRLRELMRASARAGATPPSCPWATPRTPLGSQATVFKFIPYSFQVRISEIWCGQL